MEGPYEESVVTAKNCTAKNKKRRILLPPRGDTMLYNAKNETIPIGNTEMDYIRFGTGGKVLVMLANQSYIGYNMHMWGDRNNEQYIFESQFC